MCTSWTEGRRGKLAAHRWPWLSKYCWGARLPDDCKAVQAFPWNTQLQPWERDQQQSQRRPRSEESACCSACAQPLSAEDRCLAGMHVAWRLENVLFFGCLLSSMQRASADFSCTSQQAMRILSQEQHCACPAVLEFVACMLLMLIISLSCRRALSRERGSKLSCLQ